MDFLDRKHCGMYITISENKSLTVSKAGIWLIVAVIFMRETFAPVLLERKAARRRKTTGLTGPPVKGRGDLSPLAYLRRGLCRPLKLLMLSPVVLLLSIYVAFVFGLMFLCFSTYAAVFIDQYHFSVGVSGLTYLGQGIGMVVGLGLFASLSDRILKVRAAKHRGKMTPEERLPLMVYFTPIIPVGFFWYGWTAQEKVHWMAPICATSFIGLGNLFVMVRLMRSKIICNSNLDSSRPKFTLLMHLDLEWLPPLWPRIHFCDLYSAHFYRSQLRNYIPNWAMDGATLYLVL